MYIFEAETAFDAENRQGMLFTRTEVWGLGDKSTVREKSLCHPALLNVNASSATCDILTVQSKGCRHAPCCWSSLYCFQAKISLANHNRRLVPNELECPTPHLIACSRTEQFPSSQAPVNHNGCSTAKVHRRLAPWSKSYSD